MMGRAFSAALATAAALCTSCAAGPVAEPRAGTPARPTSAAPARASSMAVSSLAAASARPVAIEPVSVVKTRPLRLADLPKPIRGPSRVVIERLGVAASVLPVGTTVAGALDVPARADTVGWYRHAAVPGGPGSVVLAAHVDLRGVRGVFFDLVELRKGDAITVDSGGAAHRYRVQSTKRVAKADIGRADVFAADGPARLVLVTCGGAFDRAARSYRDNVIVYAVPA